MLIPCHATHTNGVLSNPGKSNTIWAISGLEVCQNRLYPNYWNKMRIPIYLAVAQARRMFCRMVADYLHNMLECYKLDAVSKSWFVSYIKGASFFFLPLPPSTNWQAQRWKLFSAKFFCWHLSCPSRTWVVNAKDGTISLLWGLRSRRYVQAATTYRLIIYIPPHVHQGKSERFGIMECWQEQLVTAVTGPDPLHFRWSG